MALKDSPCFFKQHCEFSSVDAFPKLCLWLWSHLSHPILIRVRVEFLLARKRTTKDPRPKRRLRLQRSFQGRDDSGSGVLADTWSSSCHKRLSFFYSFLLLWRFFCFCSFLVNFSILIFFLVRTQFSCPHALKMEGVLVLYLLLSFLPSAGTLTW